RNFGVRRRSRQQHRSRTSAAQALTALRTGRRSCSALRTPATRAAAAFACGATTRENMHPVLPARRRVALRLVLSLVLATASPTILTLATASPAAAEVDVVGLGIADIEAGLAA